MAKPKALATYLGPPPAGQPLAAEEFRTLERSYELGIDLAHKAIAQAHAYSMITGKSVGNEAGARLLKTLLDIFVTGMELEMKRHAMRAKLGAGKPAEKDAP